MGQNGRLLIGVVVIAGMADQGMLPRSLCRGKPRAPVAVCLLAGAIALMLAAGMAGHPELNAYTRAGLLFWLLNYAAVHLAAFKTQPRAAHRSGRLSEAGDVLARGFGLIALLAGVGVLLGTDPDDQGNPTRFARGRIDSPFLSNLIDHINRTRIALSNLR